MAHTESALEFERAGLGRVLPTVHAFNGKRRDHLILGIAIAALAAAALALAWFSMGSELAGGGEMHSELDAQTAGAFAEQALPGHGDHVPRMPTRVPVAPTLGWFVVDSGTGGPLPDAELRIDLGGKTVVVHADADGRLHFEEHEDVSWRGLGMVVAPGYCLQRLQIEARPDGRREISLIQASYVTISMQWVGACPDRPLDKFQVRVMPLLRRPSDLDYTLARTVAADSHGRAVLPLGPGAYDVIVYASGVRMVSDTIAVGLVENGNGVEHRYIVPCMLETQVKVVSELTGAPLAGVKLTRVHSNRLGKHLGPTIFTGADGIAAIPVTKVDRFGWVATRVGYARERFVVRWQPSQQGGPQLVRMRRAIQVRGNLLGFDENARVTVFGTVRDLGRPIVERAKTDAKGKFWVEFGAGEDMLVFVRDRAGRWGKRFVEGAAATGHDLDVGTIVAKDPLRVAGMVHRGAAPEGEWRFVNAVVVESLGPEKNRVVLARVRSPILESGSFRCVGLPGGTLEIRPVVGNTFGPWTRRVLTASCEDLELYIGEVISGVLQTKDGKPVAGAGVIVRVKGSNRPRFGRADWEGRFSVGGLRPGLYEVVVWVGGHKTMLSGVVAGTRGLRVIVEEQ